MANRRKIAGPDRRERVEPAPKTMGEVIAAHLSELRQVRMIQLGRSESAYHVWTMTDVWTPEARKEIYAVQKRLLEKVLNGFEVDFHLVHVASDESPSRKAAGFPVIFSR